MTPTEFQAIRVRQGWSIGGLAELLGCTQWSVQRWERAPGEPEHRHISNDLALLMHILDTVPAARRAAEKIQRDKN